MRLRNTPEPCKTCKLRRRRCDRDHNQTKCDRCTRLQLECTPCNDNFEKDLSTVQDGCQEVQNWQADADRLDSEMEQLAVMKTDVQVASTQRRPMEWQLAITNGVIRLNTPIRTMEELHMFSQASIRYLSPFIGVFEREPLRFESSSVSISFGWMSIIQQRELQKPRNKHFLMGTYDNMLIKCLTPDEYLDIIQHLIPLYLQHRIPVMGLLHVPTFLEYYHSLDNPSNNAMVLAICVDALVSLRQNLAYSSIEKRVLADAFYDKCKDLLFDELYNDPKRKLEVIFTTSFLQTYLMDTTLNSMEASRLNAVALLLCTELHNDSNTTMTRVQSIILQRHYLYLEANGRIFCMLHRIDYTMPEYGNKVEILDDEPENTKAYMALLYSNTVGLSRSDYATCIMRKISQSFIGDPFEVILEDILVFEPIMREWWSSLPNEFRICNDPFDPDVYKLMKQSIPEIRLYPFIALQMFTIATSASILRPSDVSSAENRVIDDVIQSIRKRQISLALNSCKVLIHALDTNWNVETSNNPSFSFGVMFYLLHCLDKISRCIDIRFPQDLLDLFKSVSDTKLASVIPVGHEVPPSASLIMTSIENSKLRPYDVYEQYPFAGDALIVDVVRTSLSQLDQRLMSVR